MKFTVFTDKELAGDIAGAVLEKRESKVLLLLPGGSFTNIAPDIFSHLESAAEANGVDLSFLTITVIDERYHPDNPEHEDSNFVKLAVTSQAKRLKQLGVTFYSILKDGLDLAETAKEYDQFMTSAIHAEDTYKIGVLGVGTDYHLAGIMPLKQEYYNSFKTNYVCGYEIEDVSDAENEHSQRVTLNFNGIMKLDLVNLYAIGTNKYTVLRNLVAANTPTVKEISQRPVLFLHELKKDVYIYTDQQLFD